jgi:hypothetical protein
MRGAIEQVVLVLGNWSEQLRMRRTYVDMARRTRAASATEGHNIIDAGAAERFEQRQSRFADNGIRRPIPPRDLDRNHRQ